MCEELLLPVPVELSGSPISMSPHDIGVENSPNSTICDQTIDQHSLPSETPTTVSMNTRRLVPFLLYMASMIYSVYFTKCIIHTILPGLRIHMLSVLYSLCISIACGIACGGVVHTVYMIFVVFADF